MKDCSKRSLSNISELLLTDTCGCYYCENMYNPKEIEEWINDKEGATAICPKCGIDSVVPYNSKLDSSIDNFKILLKQWNKESFS